EALEQGDRRLAMRHPGRQAFFTMVMGLASGLAVCSVSAAGQESARRVRLQQEVRSVRFQPDPQPARQPILQQYCVTCHNQRLKTAGLTLDALDFEHVGGDAATWEKVVRKIRTGMMPPSGARRPDRAVLDGLASELESRLDRAGAVNPNAGT